MRYPSRRQALACMAATALALALAGCGGANDSGASTAADEGQEPAAEQAADEGSVATEPEQAEPEETGVWVMTAIHSTSLHTSGDNSMTSSNDSTFVLDETGNRLSSSQTSGLGDNEGTTFEQEYTNDEQGFPISALSKNSDAPSANNDEAPGTKYEYEFDEQGRPTKCTVFYRQYDQETADPVYESYQYFTYTYDKAGNIATICSNQAVPNAFSSYYDDGGAHAETWTTTTSYNESGLVTSVENMTEHDDGVKETTTTTYTWELGDDGRPVSLVTTSDADDGAERESKSTFSYDEEGNLASEINDWSMTYTNAEGEAVSNSSHYEITYEWTYVEEPSLAARLLSHLFARTSLFE